MLFLYRFLLYLVKFGSLSYSAYEKYLSELCSAVCPMICFASKCTRIVVSNPTKVTNYDLSGIRAASMAAAVPVG